MDFWATVLVLVRRWYVAVPAFVATLGVAAVAYSFVPLQYQSGAVLVLTTPLSGGTESTQPEHPNPHTNPLMNFDQSLSLTASIVIQQLSSLETAGKLGITPGSTTTYEINNGTSNPELLQAAPFIFVTGTGNTADEAREITAKVSAMADRILEQRQTELKAPASTHIGMAVVVEPTEGQPLKGSPLRAAAATGALAAFLALGAVYGFESLMTHRRGRRAEPPSREEAPPAYADRIRSRDPAYATTRRRPHPAGVGSSAEE